MVVVNQLAKQASSNAGFIRSYGMFWKASEVDWTGVDSGRRLELLGRLKQNKGSIQLANFWDQRGIYILYNDYGAYYVGRTYGPTMNLGKRLRNHHTGKNSPHQGKWDRFSWFGWRGVLTSRDEHGLQRLRKIPTRVLTDSTQTVEDIEALLIHALGTIHVGNKREETFKAAVRWDQVLWPERDYFLAKVQKL